MMSVVRRPLSVAQLFINRSL